MMIPSHWTANNLTINGVSLRCYPTGDGSKPPLVLQHGFSDNGLCWLQTALDLEAQYDIIMPDARGQGHPERVQPGQSVDMTYEAYMKRVRTFLQEFANRSPQLARLEALDAHKT